MTPGESFAKLFESMSMLTVCLWITGLILFCIEFFQPMHGLSYSLGALLIGTAFITRMIDGSPGEAFMFVIVTAMLLFIVHILSLGTQKRDWLRVSRMEKAGERNRKYGRLLGAVGIANTPIDLIGNVTIGETNLVVYSEKPIAEGARVRIAKVTADRIVVELADI